MSNHRVIAHVDMDCFYVMVEVGLRPELKGKPCAVVQYNTFGTLETVNVSNEKRYNSSSSGGIIAVSYEARAKGVKRGMSGKEARSLCPDIHLVTVPTAHGKANLEIYRRAGAAVVKILSRVGLVERASVDEAYIDISKNASDLYQTLEDDHWINWNTVLIEAENTKVAGTSSSGSFPSENETRRGIAENEEQKLSEDMSSESLHTDWWARPLYEWAKEEILLACGASIINKVRCAIKEELGYSCSAGIANNKILSKLGSSMHKPNQQTVIPPAQISQLMDSVPLSRIRGLGGKLGYQVSQIFGVTRIGELSNIPLSKLEKHFDQKTAISLLEMSRGIDSQAVSERSLPKSVTCGKTFRGSNCLRSLESVKYWLVELASEMLERLEEQMIENNRIAKKMTVSFIPDESELKRNVSRSLAVKNSTEAVAHEAFVQIQKWIDCKRQWGLTTLFLTADNFESSPSSAQVHHLHFPSSIQVERVLFAANLVPTYLPQISTFFKSGKGDVRNDENFSGVTSKNNNSKMRSQISNINQEFDPIQIHSDEEASHPAEAPPLENNTMATPPSTCSTDASIPQIQSKELRKLENIVAAYRQRKENGAGTCSGIKQPSTQKRRKLLPAEGHQSIDHFFKAKNG